MALKLTQRGGAYYIRGTLLGVPVYESTKTDDFATAQKLLANRSKRISDETVHGKASVVTFQEAAHSYLQGGGSPRFLGTFNKEKQTWSGLIGHFWDRPLRTITQDDLDAAANTLYAGTQAATRNRQCYVPFIAVWNRAHKNGWCEKRDWSHARKPKGTAAKFLNAKKRAGTTATTYDRAWQFVKAMSPAPAMLMTALFYTGMRPIELFALEDHEVNVDHRWIALGASKTGPGRGIPMHEVLVPLFRGLCERKGRVFRTLRGLPYELKEEEGGQLKTAINGARRRSGIVEISPYTARHTVSTQLVINNIHPHIKDQILGHAVDDMSRHYTHVPQPFLIDAIRTLPVIDAWANAPWMHDPLAWEMRLAEGTGKRNDLLKKAA
jgi:integrase